MLYALNECNVPIQAAKNLKAFCPNCKTEVRAKCGEIYIEHWAHISLDCVDQSEYDSTWSLEWKKLFPVNMVEQTINNRRTDIITKSGTVIKLRHSNISPEEIRLQEDSFDKMVWLIDSTSFIQNFKLRNRLTKITFRWKHPRRSWQASKRPLFIDFYDCIIRIKWMSAGYYTGGICEVWPKQKFISWVLGNEI